MTTDKNNGSKAAKLLAKLRKDEMAPKKPRGQGKPFEKGADPRRNVKGSKPRTATLLKEMILDIAAEEMKVMDPTTGKEETVTVLYWMVKRMMLGKAPADHSDVLNRGFGKVADEINHHHFNVDEFLKKNMDLLTDGQLTRLAGGEDPQNVMSELLSDLQALKKNK